MKHVGVSLLLVTIGFIVCGDYGRALVSPSVSSMGRSYGDGPSDCTPTGEILNETYGACAATKIVNWRVSWPDNETQYLDSTGQGGCDVAYVCCDQTLRTTECWPAFYMPNATSSGTFSQTVGRYQANVVNVTCYGGCPNTTEVQCSEVSQFTFSVSHTCPSSGCTDEQCAAVGAYCDHTNGNCYTPIIIDTEDDGFALTDANSGVMFDIDADGALNQISWTTARTNDAWLALDRDNDGRITSGVELFGNFTPQPASPSPNGFLALAEYDKPANGGYYDGQIDRRDSIFSALRLWKDANHNGISEPRELYRLHSLGVASVSVDYSDSRRRDGYGNIFRYRALVEGLPDFRVGRWAFDVFLVGP